MTHYLPAPINQFNRLIYLSGSSPTGEYALGTPWNCSRNGIDWDGYNCTAAMGSLLITADTQGAKNPGPCSIRSHQSDWSGGIGWDDVNDAFGSLYGRRLGIPQGVSWADVIAYLRAGRVVGIQGDYDQVPYSYQCQKGGTFDHAFALGDYRASDGRVLLYDPLCRNAKWVPQSTIRYAAEKLARSQGRTIGQLFVMVTRELPSIVAPPIARYEAHVPAGRFWRFYVSGYGTARPRVTSPYRLAGTTGGFSATCSPPFRAYDDAGQLPGDSYPLVRLLSGSRAGQYIDAKYAERSEA